MNSPTCFGDKAPSLGGHNTQAYSRNSWQIQC